MKLLRWTVATLFLGGALAGCGGGGGGGGGLLSPSATPTPTSVVLTGKQAVRAAVTSGYQSFRAAVNYPFAGLQLALPPGSKFRLTNTGTAKRAASADRTTRATPIYDADLGLYEAVSTSGNVTTINFYSDAAGTQGAGVSTLTAPSGGTVGANYATYPAVIQITQNITGGNIPCQGSGTITINGSSGANTINGTLNLPKTGLKVTANLTLSDAGQVGGTVTIVGNGQTITMTNLSGPFPGDLVGQVAVAPDGTTGSGTINLLSGKFTVSLTTKNGQASSSSDGSGALNITFPDGVGEKLTAPLGIVAGTDPNATPTPSPTATPTTKPTAGPTPTPTTPQTVVFNAPVALNFQPKGINNGGAFAAWSSSTTAPSGSYASGPTAALQALPLVASGGQNVGALPLALNNNGALIGYIPGLGVNAAVYWNSATATAQMPAGGSNASLIGINDNGALIGGESFFGGGVLIQNGLFWPGVSQASTPLKPVSGDTIVGPLALNNANQMIGYSGKFTTSNRPVYWSSPTATPTLLASPLSSQFTNMGLNAKGNIFLTNVEGQTQFYSSSSAQPLTLPALVARANNAGGAVGMNAAGVLVGASYSTTPIPGFNHVDVHAVRWVNGQVQDLNALIPANSGWALEYAQGINDSGTIYGKGIFNGKETYFYLSPK